jgi:hypothetical protein
MQDERSIFDWTAVTIAVGTFFEFLPAISALLSVIWLSLRIYETDTVQRLLGRVRGEEK